MGDTDRTRHKKMIENKPEQICGNCIYIYIDGLPYSYLCANIKEPRMSTTRNSSCLYWTGNNPTIKKLLKEKQGK